MELRICINIFNTFICETMNGHQQKMEQNSDTDLCHHQKLQQIKIITAP